MALEVAVEPVSSSYQRESPSQVYKVVAYYSNHPIIIWNESDFIRPIALPSINETEPDHAGDPVTIAGWGHTYGDHHHINTVIIKVKSS